MADARPPFDLAAFSALVQARAEALEFAASQYGAALDLVNEAEPATINLAYCARLLHTTRPTLYRHLATRKHARDDR